MPLIREKITAYVRKYLRDANYFKKEIGTTEFGL